MAHEELFCNPKSLGVTFMDETNGTTGTVANNNADRLNEYLQNTGSGSLVRTRGRRRPLFFPQQGIGIGKTVKTGMVNASAQYSQVFGQRWDWGGGQGFPLSEAQINEASATIAGGMARLVCIDKSGLDDVGPGTGDMTVRRLMVRDDSYGLEMVGGVNVFGYWHPTQYNSIVWDTGLNPAALSEAAARALYGDIVGMLVCEQQTSPAGTSVGMGKLRAGAMCFACMGVGIQLGQTALGDNADQISIQDLRTPFCFTGIRCESSQALGHWIGHYEGIDCPLMFDWIRGGDCTVARATLETPGGTYIKARACAGAESGFYTGKLKVDGNAGANCVILNMTADGDNRGESFHFDFISCDPTLDYKHNFVLRPYSVTKINHMEWARDGMFVMKGINFDTHMPVAVIDTVKMQAGSPTDFVKPNGGGANDSTGTWRIEVQHVMSAGGPRLAGFIKSRNNAGTVTTLEYDLTSV